MNRKLPRTPTKNGSFKSLPSHALVSTCWAEEVSDFQHPPTITTIKAIKTIWLCEEDPSHWIIMTPTFRLFQRREEEFQKKGQEEPREEAPPKEEEEMPLKGEMLPEEEEIRLEFMEMFQEGGKRQIQKKREKKNS